MGKGKVNGSAGHLTALTVDTSMGGGTESGRQSGRRRGGCGHEDDPGRTRCHFRCRASPAPRLVIGLLLMAALVGCEEDMGTEDWLIVDNRTDSEVFITDAGTDLRNSLRGNETTGFDILGSIGAGSQGWGAGAVEQCDARALIAHGGSPDGPVVARRPKADGQACVKTWVIGPDD